jgi:hypothetical protein
MNIIHNQLQQELQEEAKDILDNAKLLLPFNDNGTTHIVGSYDLGLLVYGDLDIYYEPSSSVNVIDIFTASIEIAMQSKDIITMRFERELFKKEPKCPPGMYLQFKLRVMSRRIWQIDIWAPTKEYLDDFFIRFSSLKSKLTPQNKELILKIKHELTGPENKTPRYFSYFLYKAILEENLTDLNEIKDYLTGQGIELF